MCDDPACPNLLNGQAALTDTLVPSLGTTPLPALLLASV